MDNLTYFDVLIVDITLLILSKLDHYELIGIFINYNIHKMLLLDDTWRKLFILSYLDEYNFIINLKNMGCGLSWKKLHNYYFSLEGGKRSHYDNNDLLEIYSLNLISKRYPNFYNQIKDINLKNSGISRKINISWYYLELVLKRQLHLISGNKFFYGIYTYEQYVSIRQFILSSQTEKREATTLLIDYVYFKNQSIWETIFDNLERFITHNTDMYENLLKHMFSLTSKSTILNKLKEIHSTSIIYNLEKIILIQDIKKRLNEKI